MKLSVLLITGSSDRVALETVANIAAQSGEQVKDIFLIIAGDLTDENRKKLYLERAAAFGMTAFINIGGKSEAELLNTFVKYANAEFCTVMRAGTKVDTGYFPRLIAALEENSELNFACGYRVVSGRETLPKERSLPKGVLELDKVFCAYPDSCEGVAARTAYLAEHPFEVEAGRYAERKNMLLMLNDCRKFWYDSGLTVMLAKQEKCYEDAESFPPEAGTAVWHTEVFDKCLLPVEESCKGKDGRLPLFLQHHVTAEVMRRIDYGRMLADFPKEERSIVTEKLTAALRPVEDKVLCGIYGDCLPVCFIEDKRILLGLKHGRDHYYTDMNYDRSTLYAVQKDIVIFDSTSLVIRIDLINCRKNELEIDGRFDDVFNQRKTKLIAEYAGSEYRLTYDGKGEKHTLFGKEISQEKSFHVTMPVCEDYAELRFFMLFKGCRYEIKQEYSGQLRSRLLDDSSGSFYRLTGDICATSEGGRLITQQMTEKEQRRRFRENVAASAHDGVPFGLRAAYSSTQFWFRGKNIWLFADDTSAGGGAAEDMFRYAMTRHDELYCYYLTDRDSEASARLIADGYKPLYKGSLLHKLIYLNAQVYITTKPYADITNLGTVPQAQSTLGRNSRKNVIMLQNSEDDMPTLIGHSRLRDNVRLYFCGTGEYIDELKKPEYGYENTDVLRLTGLTSYDRLHDISGEDKLLLILARYEAQEAAVFTETEFFKGFRALLENKAFTEALEKSGYTLTIAFDGVTNDEAGNLPVNEKVTVLTDEFDDDELKCRAALIVTDDGTEKAAGIMRKPLIYFGGEGGYEFGERADDAEKLAELLCGYLENGVSIKKELSQKADEYFGAAELGCQREIYNSIITWLYENGEIDGYEDFEVADGYDDEE